MPQASQTNKAFPPQEEMQLQNKQSSQLPDQKRTIQKNNSIRADKFVCDCFSDVTRSQAKILIKKGRLQVGGEVIKQSDYKIFPEKDKVVFDGREAIYKKHIYIMLNKPQGVVCSTKDGLSPTVLSLVPDELQRKGLFPAGRLDKDTEGFVLITDDGELAHKMLAPKSHVPKLYYAELEEDAKEEYSQLFSHGITLATGEKCLPAEFFEIEGKKRACYVVLHEGMYHQVKRMFEEIGNKVVYLKRLSIGGLTLDTDLALGECKEILHKNVEKLLERPVFQGENLNVV